ncbi:MAG: ABC transporter substrate-binding protein [Actinomycetota bacterium]
MRRMPLKAVLPALLILVTLGLAACGDDNGDGGGGGTTASDFPPPTAPPDDAQKGGTLTVVNAADVDYIDPGAGYYQPTYMIDFATQRTIVGWPPDANKDPVPDLADGEPTISDDFKTITFKIKKGIKYSPPVDREIKAADFKYAIERGMLPGVATSYHSPYLGDLVGYDQAVAAVGKDSTVAPNISGITTPDDQTLVLKLTKPTATVAVQALSLPLGAPVPEEYAKPFDAESPSAYSEHVVGTGPYMIENDDQGNVTGYSPGKEIILVRNPNWDPSTDYRPAYVDRIDFKEGFTDVNSATRKILTGDSQVNGDILPEPQGLKLAATQYPDQLSLVDSGGNRYISLNTQIPPFDDINVRKAVIASADREALRLARGGELVGPIATHFIPPNIPGFEEAGGDKGPDLDFIANPKGDPELAAEYMRKAGFASGKYEGDDPILVIGENAGVDKQVSSVVGDIFTKLGFKVNLREVSSDTAYTKFCGVPKSNYNACATTGWLKDFNDPQSILDVPFNGASIVPTNNSNWPLLDVPAINKALDKAKLVSEPQARAEAWGKVDDEIMAQAPAIPYIWDQQPAVSSANVDVVINLFNATPDLSFTSIKK